MNKHPTLYLPLEDFHILPFYGLSPDDIKLSAKNLSGDRKKIKHNTRLNFCVKALGIKGGFAEYKHEYETSIKPFFKKHQLNDFANLVTPRCSYSSFHSISNLFKLTHQDISERLFFSELSLTNKLFTGYNFPYDKHFEDGHFLFYSHFVTAKKSHPILPNKGMCESNIATSTIKKFITEEKIRFKDLVDLGNQKRALIDFVLGSGLLEAIHQGFNLIGSQLTYPRKDNKCVLQLYHNSDVSPDEIEGQQNYNALIFNAFMERLHEINKGWVEIIPYNDNLIFLKGDNGQYDIVLRNQRDKKFSHKSKFEPYLKRSEIPKFNDDYHFERWYYFEYKGFRQRKWHEAEKKFYACGGDHRTYPIAGGNKILIDHLGEAYTKTLPSLQSNKRLDGFAKVELSSGKKLMVSNLISIDNFEEFKKENTEYFNRRVMLENLNTANLDILDTANNENNNKLPMAVTGYDVLKFIDWYSNKKGIQARLLSLDEYKEVTPFVSLYEKKDTSEIGLNDKHCVFIDNDGNEIRKPPYMAEDKFQSLKMCYKNPQFKKKGQLNFMDSHFFAEWLRDLTCIRSNSLTSFDGDDMLGTKPPLTSTGRYKYIKIGFRLCYEFKG